jgi:iron complex outermembrane receptor protein
MTYAQVSTGYKGGGVNPRPFYNVQAFTFDPEELTSYELGVKTQLLQDTLRLNAAVFSTKYDDIQLQLSNCTVLVAAITGDPNTPLGVPCLGIANAGNADVMGAELEFDWAPNSALLVDGSISYLDFEYTSIDPATGLGIRTVDPVTGRSHRTVTPYTPEIKASIGMQYTFDVGSGGVVTPRVDVSYQDEIYSAADNSQLGAIDSYTLVNARLTWRSLDQDWQATLEARNVADKLYYLSKTDSIPGGGGVTYGAPGLPRTYLFTVKRSF